MQWHPIKPVCVSASSDQGIFHIWVTNIVERWSAYAAGFEELEENLEYQEREDEFDVEDEDQAQLRNRSKQEIAVDVLSMDGQHGKLDASQAEIAEFVASSDEWADQEPDEDDKDDFSPPLDADLAMYDLDERDVREAGGTDVTTGRAGRR